MIREIKASGRLGSIPRFNRPKDKRKRGPRVYVARGPTAQVAIPAELLTLIPDIRHIQRVRQQHLVNMHAAGASARKLKMTFRDYLKPKPETWL